MFKVTKHYPHSLGLSACFRQWRAESHCHHLHGYALAFTLTFGADLLDKNNWVIDFGSLKPIKAMLEENFDHKLLVAHDDPELDTLKKLTELDLAHVRVVEATGCEAFAKLVFEDVALWLLTQGQGWRGLRILSVTCAEHEGNSATYAYEEKVQ